MHVEKQADFLKRSFFPDRLSWESAGGGNRSGERRSLMLAEKQAELLKRSFFPIGFLGRAREGGFGLQRTSSRPIPTPYPVALSRPSPSVDNSPNFGG